MNRRNSLIILGFVALLLLAAIYLVFVRQPVSEATQLGLDLQGGVSVQLEGSHTDGSEVTREDMQQAVDVIRQRIDSLGVSEPEIQIQGEDQASVSLPGVTDTEQAVELIGRTAQLGFYEVLASQRQQSVPEGNVDGVKGQIRSDLKNSSDYEEGETKILFEETPTPQGEGTDVAGYVLLENPALTGDAVNRAYTDSNQAGKRIVGINLTGDGGQGFEDLTRKIVNDSVASGQPGQLAIVLDREVVSAPAVTEPIPGGEVSINNNSLPGGLPQQEAQNLETVLDTGALPVTMEVLSVRTVGPTLGTQSLEAGLIAAAVGFALVLTFFIFVYRVLGVLAATALLIYALLLWGIVVAVPVTLTLAGIAGIVLSIGVAADANIVIFERIKEEIQRGKSPRSAIEVGYEKGFRAILDGNVTTLITAFILFTIASGSVKGFAVLLSIGVVLSMFTAIVITRALLGLISGQGFRLTPPMFGVPRDSIRKSERPAKAGAG